VATVFPAYGGLARPPVVVVFRPGSYPRRRWLVFGTGVLLGVLMTALWTVLGAGEADTVAGHLVTEIPVVGVVVGLMCVVVFGVGGPSTAGIDATLRPLCWLSVGTFGVSATYGVIVALVGTGMPQFATGRPAPGTLPGGSIQSMLMFGLIGLFMAFRGLAALGLLRDPLARIRSRRPNAPMVITGVVIGGLLVARPFALFDPVFRDVAERHDVAGGALAFALPAVVTITVISVLFLVIRYGTGGQLQRWFSARPTRVPAVSGAGFIGAGVFMFLYWEVRLLAGVFAFLYGEVSLLAWR
jgi:hypothetical protein